MYVSRPVSPNVARPSIPATLQRGAASRGGTVHSPGQIATRTPGTGGEITDYQ